MITATVLAAFALQAKPITIHFKPLAKGGIQAAGRSWIRTPIALSSERPSELKKFPEFSAARFGWLVFGKGKFEKRYLVALDEPAGSTRKDAFGKEVQERTLYVDLNGNGDLTDDPRPKTTISTLDDYKDNGQSFSWEIETPLYLAGETVNGAVMLEYFLPGHPWKDEAGKLEYITDFGLVGTAKIGGKTYKAALRDLGPFSCFDEYGGRRATLWLDRDNDGKMDFNYEAFSLKEPFCLDGVTYEIKNVEPTGASLELVRSKKNVLEKPVPKTFIPKVGKVMPTFYANSVDGKFVALPSGYRGKLLLIDYWATWCGPCLAEAPSVVSAAKEFADRGLVVVGVSLDDAGKADEIKKVAKENALTWEHVYDGLAWKSPMVANMRVDTIPTAFLVDGDTGVILAMGRDLRGEQLRKTIEAILKKRPLLATSQ